jgi:protein-disulfide isomerase
MTMTNEHPDREAVMAWIDGELPVDERAMVQTHMDTCVACRQMADELRGTAKELAAWRVDAPPASLADRVHAAARQPASPVVPAPRASSALPASPAWQRPLVWVAALVMLGLLTTVRIQCAPGGPVCARPRVHFSFMETPVAVPALVTSTAPARRVLRADALSPAARERFESEWNTRPHVGINRSGQTAPVVVVMFLDWQCPACRAVHGAYGPIFEAWERSNPGAVTVVLKDYPLNSSCNSNVSVAMHAGACAAAVAVRLARERGTAEPLIAWLFANQETLTPESVKAGAETIAGITDFDARYADTIALVARDTADGGALHVQFTPTIYINGVRSNGDDGRALAPYELDLAIQIELRKAGVIK